MKSASKKSAGKFDQESYRRDVLDPAVGRRDMPPPDLMVRYAITEDLAHDTEAFDERIAEVEKYWRSIVLQKRYSKLARGLLVAHEALKDAKQVSYQKFARQLDEHRDRAGRQLESAAADLAAMTSVIGPDAWAGLTGQFGGFLSDQAIREALIKHEVAITEQPWPLPARPVAACRTLATELTVLGLTLAAEAVFDTHTVRRGFRLREGFRLSSGDRLDQGVLEEKKGRVAANPHSERRTALENVLTTLHTAAGQPGGLDALLLWQLIDVLEPQLAAGFPPRALARTATDFGLEPSEAPELALAIFSQHQTPRNSLRRAIEAALKSGEILRARRLAAELPSGDDTYRKAAEAVTRIEGLLSKASAAEQEGDAEQSAELLTEILATDYDEDGRLEFRLQGLVPPPPGSVRAAAEPGGVRVEWGPGGARTGGISYRVIRQAGGPAATAAAGPVVAETRDLTAIDDDPPPGQRLYYCVFASRGRDAWSAGAAAPEVIVLPEVADPQFEIRDAAVHGTWRVAPGTTGVLVARGEWAPPGQGQGLPRDASLMGFVDGGVRVGVRYYYRIRAVYTTTSGERLITPGLIGQITTEVALRPVNDLRAELLPGAAPAVALTWTAPETGTARIYRLGGPATRPPGTVARLDDLARLGRPVAGNVVAGPEGRSLLRTGLVNGQNQFCAVTVGIDRAVLGATASAAAMAPVRDLAARRYGQAIRLSWTWPDGCYKCLVRWQAGPPPGEPGPAPEAAEAECGRGQYHHSGSFEITVGPHRTMVSVQAIERTRDSVIASVPAQVEVPRAEVIVRYRFRPGRWWAPWRRTGMVLTAAETCEVPPLVVVHSQGRAQPLRADQGTPVFRTQRLRLAAGSPAWVPVRIPQQRGGDWITCFLDESETEGVALVPDGRR
jgi:hypothetical protein